MAFLSQYRKLRACNTRGFGEVEYNFGRAFHQLGLCAASSDLSSLLDLCTA
jgi:hypothetical protein